MLTKAQFSILPNRSQAQKEAKTRTFSHGNYNQILEAYLHVPTWGDSPSFQRLRVTRSKPVVPGRGGGAGGGGASQLSGKEAEAGTNTDWRKPFS